MYVKIKKEYFEKLEELKITQRTFILKIVLDIINGKEELQEEILTDYVYKQYHIDTFLRDKYQNLVKENNMDKNNVINYFIGKRLKRYKTETKSPVIKKKYKPEVKKTLEYCEKYKKKFLNEAINRYYGMKD